MTIFRFTFFVCTLLMMSCKPEIKQDEKQVYDDMMEIHNKVMPKMGELNTLKRDLMSFNHDVDETNTALKDSVLNNILKLSDAEDRMSDWMNAISERNKKVEPAKMLQFLKNEKDSIARLENDVMLYSATAKELLNTAHTKSN